MNPNHPSELVSILLMASTLTMATLGWMWQSEWGQSSNVFFGVRVPNRFEDSLDAIPIRIRYNSAVKLIPVTLLATYALLSHFVPSYRVPGSRTVLYSFVLLQAVAVRAVFWRARNETLPFAVDPEATRSASLSELSAPSLRWRMLYWSAVLAPVVLVGCAAAYVWSHWLVLHLPVDSNLRLPLTVDSPAIVWKRREVLGSLRWVIDSLLINLGAVVVAYAFNFRSRISEWGEEESERRSYRRQLMVFAVLVQWLATFASLFMVFNQAVLASPWAKEHMMSYMLWTLLLPSVIGYGFAFWLFNRLYDNRPPGFVSKAEDKHWKFGLYYVNSKDSAAIVPTRFGVGETLNLAHPIAWLLLVLSTASVIIRYALPSPVAAIAGTSVLSEQDRTTLVREASALQRGDFQASERLLNLAQSRYDANLWSSIAFVLAQNQVKPHSAYNWAERAVALADNSASRLDLSQPTPQTRQDMAHLAALWSNLGFVCLQHPQRDPDCAQRYLRAAVALDPHPSYAQLLKRSEQGRPNTLSYDVSDSIVSGAMELDVSGSPESSISLDIVLSSRGETTVRTLDGGPADPRVARIMAETLRFPWPDGGVRQVLLRGTLTCSQSGRPCTLTILRCENRATDESTASRQ
jgi:uncharacterized membrane protein